MMSLFEGWDIPPDGGRIVTGSGNGTVRAPRRDIDEHGSAARGIAVTRNGTKIISGDLDGFVYV